MIVIILFHTTKPRMYLIIQALHMPQGDAYANLHFIFSSDIHSLKIVKKKLTMNAEPWTTSLLLPQE